MTQPTAPAVRIAAALAGATTVAAGLLGLAYAAVWALMSALPVGSMFAPETERDQTLGVLLAAAGGLLAGTSVAAGLTLLLRGVTGRWPGSAVMLSPPFVALLVILAAAIFGGAQG